MKFEFVEWEEIKRLTKKLAQKIKSSKFKPDWIVGIARGGWIPARILSDLLENKNITSMRVEFYTSVGKRRKKPVITQKVPINVKNKKILLVDDVADTGESLRVAYQSLKKAKEVKIATLHYKPHSKLKPDFFVQTTSAWIVYPWEKKETKHKKPM